VGDLKGVGVGDLKGVGVGDLKGVGVGDLKGVGVGDDCGGGSVGLVHHGGNGSPCQVAHILVVSLFRGDPTQPPSHTSEVLKHHVYPYSVAFQVYKGSVAGGQVHPPVSFIMIPGFPFRLLHQYAFPFPPI
jgi:hypothetical protein